MRKLEMNNVFPSTDNIILYDSHTPNRKNQPYFRRSNPFRNASFPHRITANTNLQPSNLDRIQSYLIWIASNLGCIISNISRIYSCTTDKTAISCRIHAGIGRIAQRISFFRKINNLPLSPIDFYHSICTNPRQHLKTKPPA